jgi:hypothetical protein
VDSFERYRDDPVGFVREVLGGDPWARQVEILEAVRDHARVTVRSCHGVGKTYVAACAALWRLHCFSPSVVLTTAPGHRQVKDVFWRQIRRLQNRARVKLPGEVRETAIKIAEDTFALGFATDEGDRFQGFHSPHLFIVVEEASGVSEAIFEAIDGCLTTDGSRILMIGNPTRATGRFRESHRTEGWRRIQISAFDSPNVSGASLPVDAASATEAPLWPELVRRELVTPRWVWERQEEWGIESPIYQIRVLGEFPDAGEDTLIPLSWIEAAHARWRSGGWSKAEPAELGVDVARYGGCETVVIVRRGGVVSRVAAWMGQDLMASTNRIVAIAREEAPVGAINVDVIGLGAGVVDRLREQGVPHVYGVNVASRAQDGERYDRRRDELFFVLRERFRTGEIALPPDDRLRAQLASLGYGYTSGGRLQVESKEELRRRGLRSPDRADALMLAFAPATGGGGDRVACGPGRPGIARIGSPRHAPR